MLLLLAVALLLSYAPAISGGFIWDDDDYVTHNATLRSVAGLLAIWLDPRATPQYYPLVHTSFWIEYRCWGLQPAGFHLVNVLLHGLNSLLLWGLLRRLGLPGAAIAAVLFAFHPVQVESVAWITERKNTLSACFYLLAARCYLAWAMPERAGRPRSGSGWIGLSMSYLCFAAALLSKSVTCTLPAGLLLVLWWRRGTLRRRDLFALSPMFVLGVAYGLLTIRLERIHVGAEGQEWNFTWAQHLLIAGRALWFYPLKVLWPMDLAFIYPRWNVDPTAPVQWMYPAAWLTLLTTLLLLRRRFGGGALLAALLYTGALFPALGFFNVYPMRYSFVADHFAYHALIPVWALAGALLARTADAWSPRRLRWAVVRGGSASLLIGLASLTFLQSSRYTDLKTLWQTNIRVAPAAWMPYSNLGILVAREGRMEEAIWLFRRAIEIHPHYAEAHYNLGTALLMLGRHGEAESSLRRAIAIHPNYHDAHRNLGHLLLESDRAEEAIQSFRRGLRGGSEDAALYMGIGQAEARAGRLDLAVEAYVQAGKIDPRSVHADARVTIGVHRQSEGRYADAIREFRQVLTVQPDHLQAMNNLAWLLATVPDPRLRSGPEAVGMARGLNERTANRNPHYLDTLAAAYAEQGRFPDAVATARLALSLSDPSDSALRRAIELRIEGYLKGIAFHGVAP